MGVHIIEKCSKVHHMAQRSGVFFVRLVGAATSSDSIASQQLALHRLAYIHRRVTIDNDALWEKPPYRIDHMWSPHTVPKGTIKAQSN